MREFYICLCLAVIESIALIFFSVQTGYGSGHDIFSSELQHFVAYAVYGFLIGNSLRFKSKNVLLAVFFASWFGLFTELLQYFVPTRFADPLDWFIDTVGAFFGLGFLKLRTASFFLSANRTL